MRGVTTLARTGAQVGGGALKTVYRAGQQFGAANPGVAQYVQRFQPTVRRAYSSSMPAPSPVRIPNTPMRRGITPLPFSQFGTRYSPSTLTTRVRNAGLEVAIRRDTRSARLVPNHFNSLGQQVYNRKAQTVRRIPDEPDIVANGIDARMRARTDRFLRSR